MRCERCKKEKNETTRFCMYCGHDHGNSDGENRISYSQVNQRSESWQSKMIQTLNQLEDTKEYDMIDQEGTVSTSQVSKYFGEKVIKFIIFLGGLWAVSGSFLEPITEVVYYLEEEGLIPVGVTETVGSFFDVEVDSFEDEYLYYEEDDYTQYVYEDTSMDVKYSNQLGPVLEYFMDDLRFVSEYISDREPIVWAVGEYNFENEYQYVVMLFEYHVDDDVVSLDYLEIDGLEQSVDEGEAFLAQLFETYEAHFYE